MEDNQEDINYKFCPICAEYKLIDSKVCVDCGSELN